MTNNFKATAKRGGISVTNQRGELVCYVMLEKAYVAPGATPEEATQAGDAADLAIEIAARNAGAASVVLSVGGSILSERARRSKRALPQMQNSRPALSRPHERNHKHERNTATPREVTEKINAITWEYELRQDATK